MKTKRRFCCRMVDVSKAFSEEIFGISMHPSGLMAALGCADKLRVLTILLDDVR